MSSALDTVMHTLSSIDSALSLLSWDQETYMPSGAAEARAEQLSALAGLRHQELTSPDAVKAGQGALASLDSLPRRRALVVQRFVEEQERELKLPAEHVRTLARETSLGHDAWKRAKMAKDFSLFRDVLERITALKVREAELLGYEQHPYDAMLNLYEPGLTVEQLNPVFAALAQGTRELLAKLKPLTGTVNSDVLFRSYDKQQQLRFGTEIAQAIGFSMDAGRIDLSDHPFCTHFARTDVRLTTRIRENDVRSCLFGLIHEAGHGMYEQGVSAELAYTWSSQGASMGIHESQSLFWENVIGRSEEFWQWAFPRMRDAFPEQLADQTPESLYKAINVMQPTLNRVESDELTYNLHIILRFEMERDLMTGALAVKDIPTVWNEKMGTLLGVVPPDDAEGCLQDVHWSFGGIGYFPSYSLGKLYAAMLWTQLQQEMPAAADHVANGNFAPILSWLRTNIHDYGKTELPNEIIQRVCHRPLTESDFLAYVNSKATRVYGV
jgi:carboxypeptidase Taq